MTVPLRATGSVQVFGQDDKKCTVFAFPVQDNMPVQRKITIAKVEGGVQVSELIGGEWYREFFTDRDSLIIYSHKNNIEIDENLYFPCA